jgi:pyruvate formate lyase activating enzyme
VSACPVSRPQVAGGALLLPTREAAVEDLFEQVRPQLEIVRQGGGLTLSGGEALLQLEGASRLLKLARDAGLQTAVESSGAVPREHFEAVAGLVDCWLFGLRSDHPATAAAKGFGVKADNLRFIASLPTRVIVRKPLVAGITDCKEELEATADLMSECGLSEIDLLPLNPHTAHYYQALGLPCPPQGLLVPSGSQVSAAADFFSRRGFKVTVGQKTPSATGANQQKQIGPSVSAPPFREQTQTGGI